MFAVVRHRFCVFILGITGFCVSDRPADSAGYEEVTMLIKLTIIITTIAVAFSVGFAQEAFKPRNADEAHAWRLHDQYQASKKKEAQIQQGISQTSGDIKTVNVGSIPGLGIDPQDVARLTKLKDQLKAEHELQSKLEAAWDKKFYGRYGDLSDSNGTIYDPKTKKTMDKIQFRLVYFPFYVNDGTYSGPVAGASGTITLVVKGTAVTGSMRGVYKYTLFDEVQSESYSGNVAGSLSNDGVLTGQLSGTVGGTPFSGSLRGTISKGVISGTWTTKALTTASGSFTARRK